MKDFSRNQINIIGEVYLMRIGYPHEIYRKMVQLSIPVTKTDKAVEKQEVIWPLSVDMPPVD